MKSKELDHWSRARNKTCSCTWCMQCLCIWFVFISKELEGFICKLWNIEAFWSYMRISHQIYQVKKFSRFFHVLKFFANKLLWVPWKFSFYLMIWMRMNAWMHECNNHTQGSSKAHQTKVVGKLIVSLISIIHFGGFRFSPYRHPSSIDINGTWTGSNILNINHPFWGI